MKKKKLEALPPIALREAKRKYYRLVAETMDIDGEMHLVCDVYRKDGRQYAFIMRAAYTAHDWGLWWPETGWRKCSIEGNAFGWPVYDECSMISGPGIPKKASWANTAVDELSLVLIRGFSDHIKTGTWARNEEWYRFLKGVEREIRSEREEKEKDSRDRKLQKRIKDMPAIPADFCAWADREIFDSREYVYYKRGRTWADCRCSKCGAEYRIRTSRPNTYEGQLLRVYPTPRGDMPTNCQICGANASYKPRGRCRNIHGEKNKAYLIQPFRETGVVVRYFEVHKEWSLTEESVVYETELGRVYLGLLGRERCDWHLYDHFRGTNGWYDHQAGGMGNISLATGAVYMGNAAEWKDVGYLRYSGLKEYIGMTGIWQQPTYYLAAAERMPLERLVKMGMPKLVRNLISKDRETGLIKDPKAGEAHRMLGIRRCRLSLLREHQGDPKLLRTLKLERENTQDALAGERKGRGEWTEEQIWKVRNLDIDKKALELALGYMSITQFLNRVERYAGKIPCESQEENMTALGQARYRNAATIYTDYLRMRQDGGYGMERSTDIFPRNVFQAHNQLVLEQNRKENDDRIEKYEKKFPKVKKRFRELKARYGFKTDGLFIRPAKDIREIIEEGQILHHCVGRGDFYIRKHNDGMSFILFLRSLTAPNDPDITIEVEGEYIRQWYGRNDTKPDKEVIEPFLASWLEDIRARKEKKDAAPAAAERGNEQDNSLQAG